MRPNSGSSNGYAPLRMVKSMNNEKSYEERVKETFTKGLRQRIDESSKSARSVYYCLVALVFALTISVHIYFFSFS